MLNQQTGNKVYNLTTGSTLTLEKVDILRYPSDPSLDDLIAMPVKKIHSTHSGNYFTWKIWETRFINLKIIA